MPHPHFKTLGSVLPRTPVTSARLSSRPSRGDVIDPPTVSRIRRLAESGLFKFPGRGKFGPGGPMVLARLGGGLCPMVFPPSGARLFKLLFSQVKQVYKFLQIKPV